MLVSRLSNALDLPMPELPEEENITRIEGSIVFADKKILKEREAGTIVAYESEDERMFYEDLLDLSLIVPQALLSKSKDQKQDEPTAAEDIEKNYIAENPDEKNYSAESPAEETSDKIETEEKYIVEESVEEALGNNEIPIADNENLGETTKRNNALDEFLTKLQTIQSRDLVDKAAIEFCYLNSKGARKRLIKTLLVIPKNRLDIIPYYGRFIATLSKSIPEISEVITQELEKEFKFYVRKKEIRNYENRIKV